jgi:glycosyltransferase involved in cell wall biosynthesis
MPSRWQEPFGLINIEAGAARRPMVASCVGGIPEVIRDGENGLLFDPDDFTSFVRAVRRLIDDKMLRAEMGRRARVIVEEEFTTKPIRRLEALYDAVAKR